MKSSNFRPYMPPLLLMICGIALSWPLWHMGFPPQTDDAKCHVAWFAHFSSQFAAGEWFPRWLPNMNAGLGSPAFFYYPPLASWMSCVFNFIFSTNDLWLAVGRSASAALIASGFAMYAWLQTFVPRRWAFVGALVFLIGPYRNTTDIYVRGALAEHWAFVWLPLMLWATQNLVTQSGNRVRAWCASTALFALLWLTHPPTVIIFAPVVLAFAVFASSTRSAKSHVITAFAVLTSTFGGALLSAIYLLPALGMESLVWMEEMRVGDFSYENAFLTLENARGGFRLQAVSLVSLLLMTTCCFAIVKVARNSNHQMQSRYVNARFWFAVTLVAVFMTTVLSAPLYAMFSPLARIQFPYRWLGVVSVAVAPLVAETLTCWSQRDIEHSMSRAMMKWRICGATCGFIALLWISLQVVYIRKAYPQFALDAPYISYVNWYVKNGAEMPGHRPRDARTLKTDAPALYRKIGKSSPEYELAEVLRGLGKVRVLENTPRRIELEIAHRGAQSVIIRVRQFNFGVWRATSCAKILRVSSSVPDGLILIEVPTSARRVILEMPPTTSEIWGKNLSFMALAIWMVLLCSTWIRSRKS